MALAGTPAFAQDAAAGATEDEDVILVTGSRIARANLETAAPIAQVDAEEFKLSGAINVEQVVNTLPQVIPGTTSFSNNPGGGVATLNLRGLGTTRTMVLVNGRRWMFFDPSQVVDLNTIPSFLLEGVDVVTGGASAVYGSDAIAGVVNFRLMDVDGLIVGGQTNITGEGDGARYEAYAALGGEIGDRGNATVFAEYYKRGSVFQGDRAFSFEALGENADSSGLIPGGSSTTPDGRFTSTYAAAVCPAGNVFCGPAGAYYPTPGESRQRLATDLYNYAPANYLMVPQERYLLGGYADYEFVDGHTGYAEVTFVNNRVANELAATPVTGTFQVQIAAVTPFISAADVAALNQLDAVATTGNTVGDGIVPLAVQRRVVETGSRNSLDERNAFRALFGVRGEITSSLNYDLYYSYARTRNSNVQAGNISRSAFQRGLNGVDPAINIFGPNTLTPDMVNQISILAQNGEISELQVLNGSVSGYLGNFGWGADDIGFAVGAEYRKMSSEFIPDTALSSGDVIGFNAGLPTEGSYDVKEAFAELRLPIISDASFFHDLELNAAARYSDYSLDAVGGTWTYAGGIMWAPVRDITFRGQYQRAVRAPNVGELFGGQTVGFPPATDPCAQADAATDATVRALCIATGVPAGAVGTAAIQLNPQIQGLFGGNPDLQEETSDSWTAGVVFTPGFLPGFSMTLDWYNITVDDVISTLGGGLNNSLNLCYNVIQDINSDYCQAFVGTRNALGQFDGTNPPQILNANVSKLEVEGWDLGLDYTTALGFGDAQLNLSFLGTYTTKSDLTAVADLPDQVNECADRFGILACGNPTPEFKWTSRASFIDGPFTASLRWRHLSSVEDDDPDSLYFVEVIPSYDLFDISFAYEVNEILTVAGGVNNVLDDYPTQLGFNQEQANTYPGTYDVLGRDFFVSFRLGF
jgi:outer membrane receptor protein involved in Fe transport